jgi:hypothetical protein
MIVYASRTWGCRNSSHYGVNCSSFILLEYYNFPTSTLMHLSHIKMSLEFHCGRNEAPTFRIFNNCHFHFLLSVVSLISPGVFWFSKNISSTYTALTYELNVLSQLM